MAFYAIVAVLFIGGAWFASRYLHQELVRRASEIGSALGLSVSGDGSDVDLCGVRRGTAVRVRFGQKGVGKSKTEVTFIRAEGLPAGVSMSAEHFGGATLRQLTGGEDRYTGDPYFDAAVVVTGSPLVLAANLDADTRRSIKTFVSEKGMIANGEVTLTLDTHVQDTRTLDAVLDRVVDLVQRLGRTDSLVERAAAVALNDEQPGVRVHALKVVARRDALAATAVAQQLRNSPEDRIRAAALVMAGDDEALAKEPVAVLRYAALDDTEAVCKALTRAGAVDALLGLIDVDDAPVRISAARGLARVGRLEDVATLRSAQRQARGEVAEALERAIASIQARQVGAGHGQVAIAADAGQLDVARQVGAVDIKR